MKQMIVTTALAAVLALGAFSTFSTAGAESSQQRGTAVVLDVTTDHGSKVSCTLASNVTLDENERRFFELAATVLEGSEVVYGSWHRTERLDQAEFAAGGASSLSGFDRKAGAATGRGIAGWEDSGPEGGIVIVVGPADGNTFRCHGDDFPNSPYNKVAHPDHDLIDGKLYEGRVTDAAVRLTDPF